MPLLLDFRPPGGGQLFLFEVVFLMLIKFLNVEGFVFPNLFKFSFLLLKVGKDDSFMVFILNLLIVEGIIHHIFDLLFRLFLDGLELLFSSSVFEEIVLYDLPSGLQLYL